MFVGSRVRRVSTRLKEAEARFADYITRDDCSAPVRGADPLRQKRAHAQRPASRADRSSPPVLMVFKVSEIGDCITLQFRDAGAFLVPWRPQQRTYRAHLLVRFARRE